MAPGANIVAYLAACFRKPANATPLDPTMDAMAGASRDQRAGDVGQHSADCVAGLGDPIEYLFQPTLKGRCLDLLIDRGQGRGQHSQT